MRNSALLLTSDLAIVAWEELRDIIRRAELGDREVDMLKRQWQGSYLCALAFDEQRLIGGGRAISDGVTSSTIYDVVVDPGYQGQGIGKQIMHFLLERLPKRSVLLVSVNNVQGFYRKLGFRKLNSAYILMEDFSRWEAGGYFDP